jgi:hypothetical protein
MRTRRQFQPVVDGLPCRIAPSSLVVAPSASLLGGHTSAISHAVSVSQAVPVSTHGLTMSANDTDMPESGTAAPIMAGPPPSSGTGTLVC